MLKFFVFICLLALTVRAELYASYYAPNLAYYAPSVTYARTAPAVAAAAAVPLAYARLHTPAGSEVHTYNSVQTPASFQQQYRSDYKPLTYEYIY